MATCIHCLKEIEDGDEFCRLCGEKVVGSSAEEFKKCPFCAEQIKKEAVFCRYCKQELPTESGDNTKVIKSTTRLSMDDLMALFETSSQSYKAIPPKVTEEVMASSMAISEFMQEIFVEYIRFKLLSDQQLQAYANQLNGYLMCWNLVCVLIGAEHSYGSISAVDTSKLIKKINEPFFYYVAEYIDILEERKIFTEQKSGRLKSQLTTVTNNVSHRLLDFGIKKFLEIERTPTQSSSAFILEIKILIE